MIRILTIIVIIDIFIILSCTYNNSKKNVNQLECIDIEANISKMKQVNLSLFTDSIVYVPLEKVKDFPLRNLCQVDFSKNLILVSDANICLLYDFEGHFISKIGTRGRGPGEYQFVRNIGFGNHQEIYLSSLYDIYEYNIDGSFNNKYTKSLLISNDIYLEKWNIIKDSLFFGHIPNTTGMIMYKAVIFDKRGEIKYDYKNYILFNRLHEVASDFENFADIYQFKGLVFYKELYNDTLFYLNDKYELVPKYFFNLGSFKMPVSERAKDMTGNILWNYISLFDVFQTENYLILNFLFGYRFPSKRITPFTPFYGAEKKQTWYNTTHILGLWDKNAKELILCRPTSTNNPLFTTGFNNDIDCGPRFFPKAMVNDSMMVMWCEAKQFKEHVASKDFKKTIPKFPNKKKKVEELANKITEFDNPILMFVTFRK